MAKVEPQDLQKKLRKLRRRQKRNERAAWARGFLTGVCGLLKPGDVVIDCGANAGDVSATLLDTGARVIAFDPEPWAVERLKERFADHPNFVLHNAAVGTAEGTIRLMRATNFGDDAASASVKSTVVPGGRNVDSDDANALAVRQIDFIAFLRDVVSLHGEVAFLKMDIEGAELELIPAIDKAGLFASIRCAVIETHELKFRHLGSEYASLRSMIGEKYRPTHVNLDWI